MRDVSREDLISKLEEVKEELSNIASRVEGLDLSDLSKLEINSQIYNLINNIGDTLYWV